MNDRLKGAVIGTMAFAGAVFATADAQALPIQSLHSSASAAGIEQVFLRYGYGYRRPFLRYGYGFRRRFVYGYRRFGYGGYRRFGYGRFGYGYRRF